MPTSATAAQVRKIETGFAKLVSDPRLAATLGSVAGDAKLFAKAKANPKALLAKNGIKVSGKLATLLRLSRELSRPGKKATICIDYRYKVGSGHGVYDENGNYYRIGGPIEGEVCTSFLIPK